MQKLLMRCDQCAMSLEGGCTIRGVCGKDPNLNSLQNALIYGLKGISAYYYHVLEMGHRDNEVEEFIVTALYTTLTNVNFDPRRFFEYILEAGRINLKVLELLDKAYVEKFGVPRPTRVPIGTTEGHSILVTGHSYRALYELLRQIREAGLEDQVKVYTHSEMLPAHSYPELKKYKSLWGHWGGSWVNQRVEFSEFPGVVIGTTNCVLQPLPKYENRIYTIGITGLAGVKHIKDYNFEEVIKHALKTPKTSRNVRGEVITGWHHLNVPLDKLIDLIQEGKIRRIFVVGGCDSPNPRMGYYARLVELLPRDTIILTAACGKFRFLEKKLGEVEGIPRLLDFGQCNNVYSIIQLASMLSKKLGIDDINKLPITIVLSWMEQKAIAILYTLLYLGVRRIYIGPRKPEFLTPSVWEELRRKFDLRLISEPEQDLPRMLRGE